MAENETFDIRKWITGFVDPKTWGKSVVYLVMAGCILFVLLCLKNTFFPSKSIVNKPHALAIGSVAAGAIDQRSTNIVVKDSDWEVGLGGAGITYDNKNGALVGGWVKKKF